MDTTLDDPMAGEELDGRYRVESRLARGGMATVYRATDTRLDRTVAVKIMHAELARHREFTSRFIREAKAAARLSHPNVVGVFDQGQQGDHPYLVMEYIQGCTLRDLLAERGKFTPREALEILAPVLSALGAAHRAGFVHRDVKPENVLIADEGPYSEAVKVADFGLARAVTAADTSVSMAGMLIGTVSYLAPEQVTDGTTDQRSDVYSAGIVLYELLTGHKPFAAETPIEVAYKHVHENVPAPSQLVPGLDPALDALVARSTSRDPDARPANGDTFVAEVRRVVASLPDSALDFGAPASDPDQVPTQRLPHGTAGTKPAKTEPTLVGPPDVAAARKSMRKATANAFTKPRTNPNAKRKPADKRRVMPRRGVLALVVILLLAIVVTASAWWFGSGRFTRTPAVLNMSESAAAGVLHHAGLGERVHGVYSDSVPKNTVISTSPQPNGRILRHGKVTLTVSLGPQLFPVPDFTGMTQSQAEQAITGANLTVGTETQAYNDNVPSGQIIGSDPAHGTGLRRADTVNLVISKGKKPIGLPDIFGFLTSSATKTLEQDGFTAQNAGDVFSDAVPAGTVASWDPTGIAVPGTTVRLFVSKGPQSFPLPDISGKSADEAAAALEAAGWKVRVVSLPVGPQIVRSQTPSPGTPTTHLQQVTLYVY